MKLAFITVLTLFGNIVSTNADEFLRTPRHDFAERVDIQEVQASLLKEIENSLPDPMGTSSASTRVSKLQVALEPIFAALPKNQHGNAEHVAASYALHRLFGWRNGWVIKGLGPTSGKFNASSPAGILKDQVPSYIEDVFDQGLGGKGFNLQNLAVLAATIEHLVREEATQRLSAAFKIHDTQSAGVLRYSEASEMLDTYMAADILSANLTGMTRGTAKKIRAQMPDVYNQWPETQKFVRDVQETVHQAAYRKEPFPSATRLNLALLIKVAEEIGERMGDFFHDTVCTDLKKRLTALEYRSSGRIKLSDFYKKSPQWRIPIPGEHGLLAGNRRP